MKFVLQVSTGGFAQCSVEDIRGMKEKLKRLLEHLPVSRIIFGWGAGPGLLEAIAELAHQYERKPCSGSRFLRILSTRTRPIP